MENRSSRKPAACLQTISRFWALFFPADDALCQSGYCGFTNLSPTIWIFISPWKNMPWQRRTSSPIREKNDLAIFNRDNDLTHAMVCRAPGRVLAVQPPHLFGGGRLCRQRHHCGRTKWKKRPLFSTDRILIPGEHNVENYLAAIAAVQGLVPDDDPSHGRDLPGVSTGLNWSVLARRPVLQRFHCLQPDPHHCRSPFPSPKRSSSLPAAMTKRFPFDVLGQAVQDHVKT